MNSSNSFYDVLYADKKILIPHTNNNEEMEVFGPDMRTLIFIHDLKSIENEAQIEKIMAACGLSSKQYKILMPRPWNGLQNTEGIHEVILFGTKEKELDLNIQFPINRTIPFYGKTWIKTYELSTVMNNQSLKNEFWKNALKPYFGL